MKTTITAEQQRALDELYYYEVVSYGTDEDPETRKRLVARRGGSHTDPVLAAAESSARSLAQGEGKPPWVVVGADGEIVHDLECEPDNVYDSLIKLGVAPEEAERLIA